MFRHNPLPPVAVSLSLPPMYHFTYLLFDTFNSVQLMEWGHAMADCDKAIALATSGGEATKGVLVKAIARKAEVQFFLKDYNKALNTYKMGLELDNKSSMLVKVCEIYFLFSCYRMTQY